MTDHTIAATRRTRVGRRLAVGIVVVSSLSLAGVAGATVQRITTKGSGPGKASLNCPGGMSRLGHPFSEQMSIFPGDPAVHISELYSVAYDGFKVEDIDMGAHAGTHLDAPGHFIEGGRTIDQLAADEFVWPAYKIDVRGMTFTNNLIERSDIRRYEREHGYIKPGSLVILQTGAEQYFGLGGPGDERIVDANGLADNVDDLFDFLNPGFSGAAVQWMFDHRDIDGVGSDAYGPDAATDELYDATYTTLLNDGVALVALANLDSVSVNSDIIIASGIALENGSGFTTDPIACHGKPAAPRSR